MPPGRSKRTMARFHCTRHGWSGLLDFRRADVDYVDMRDSNILGTLNTWYDIKMPAPPGAKS